MSDVKKLTPNAIANLVMADDAWHDTQYVRAEDYDRLKARYDKAVFLLKGVCIEETEVSDIKRFFREVAP